MRSALLVLNAFAALWAISGLLALNSPTWMWAAPIAVAVIIAAWCSRKLAHPAFRSHENARRIRRLIGLWSAVEVLLILVVAYAMGAKGQTTNMAPAAVIIVGLHFLPLARGIPQPEYYGAAAALIVLGLAALALPAPLPSVVVGFGAALVLWLTTIAMSAARRPSPGQVA